MTFARRVALAVLTSSLAALGAGCAMTGASPPGMREAKLREHPADPSLLELARVEAQDVERALLVVYPRDACSGSASGVLVDEHGRYLGAIAPGTASLLSVPARLRTLHVFSSVEVTAPMGAWFSTEVVAVPAAPAGLVLRASRFSARQCGNGQQLDVTAASKEALELELGESPARWFVAGRREGQAWLDAHRARVDEVLGLGGKRVVTR